MWMRKLSTKMSGDASETSAEWAEDIFDKPRDKVGEKVLSITVNLKPFTYLLSGCEQILQLCRGFYQELGSVDSSTSESPESESGGLGFVTRVNARSPTSSWSYQLFLLYFSVVHRRLSCRPRKTSLGPVDVNIPIICGCRVKFCFLC